MLAGCGGGGSGNDGGSPPPAPVISSFTADQPGYFVGTTAKLTAVFQNGTGRIDPGNIPVNSGQAITTSELSEDVTYKLTVTGGGTTVTRDLPVDVSYRDRFRTINMPFSRAEHAAVTLPDGRVLVVGGDEWGATLPSSVYQFNPATETFSQFATLSTGRYGMVAVTLANGDVLVANGGKALSQAPNAEIINGATGGVTATIGSPQQQRFFATATLLANGRVLIAGGSLGGALQSAEIYDPSTGLFTMLPNVLAKARYGHSATRLDNGKVLIYGGHTDDSLPAPPELFDPATSAFTTLPVPEDFTRANHVAVKARDGRVWIIGGEDETSEPMASVLRFDQESLWALGPNLGKRRTLFAGAPLPDGRVFLAGGTTTMVSNGVDGTSELISNPQNRAGGPVMATKRFLHTTSTLKNGKVLVIGGLNYESGGPLATAEIFE